MWPADKFRAIFQSIDEQLRAQREQINSLSEQLKKERENVRRTEECLQSLKQSIQEKAEIQSQEKKEDAHELWMTKFGYDNLISNLQLALVEQVVPGNRARLEALKDTHKGETCFVIGNGPSLRAEDLTKLKEKGVFCFGSKRINLIFEETDWRPDLWAVSDLDFIHLYHDEIDHLNGFPRLVPCQSIINLNQPIRDAIYYPFIQAERRPCWFNADVTRGVHFWGTITCKLINFAVYMGFTRIYLLGVDNSVPIVVDKDGKKRYDTSVNSHFSKNYFSSEKDFKYAVRNIDDMEESMRYVTQAYKDVKWFCDDLNVQVLNATRGGCLEVYPRVSFDSIDFSKEKLTPGVSEKP